MFLKTEKMEYLLYAVLPIVGGLVLYAIIHYAVRAPGRSLSQKFVSLGNLQSKSYREIVAYCGSPTSTSAVEGGKLCQWMATGYHIALLFDENDNCLGITHNASV